MKAFDPRLLVSALAVSWAVASCATAREPDHAWASYSVENSAKLPREEVSRRAREISEAAWLFVCGAKGEKCADRSRYHVVVAPLEGKACQVVFEVLDSPEPDQKITSAELFCGVDGAFIVEEIE